MSIFDVDVTDSGLLKAYLLRLNLVAQPPSLSFLNQLIHRHQNTIPFENFSRICDFREKSLCFPTLEESLIGIAQGAGGVCWTLARSFHWLLKQLGFETEYLFMSPGHVCLKVQLSEAYYVEVGYGVPFFEARPLRTSFNIQGIAEEFEYQVQGERVVVRRSPGPVKTLFLSPYSSQQIEDEFNKGNVWGQNKFLSETLILKYENEKLIRLRGEILTDYRSGKKVERHLNQEEIPQVLVEVFRISPELYWRARKWLLKGD